MDFLDPKKSFQHRLLLYSGYLLIAVGIGIGTTILLYQAYGFGFGKNGVIIQNGLLFVSSHPNPANIYINGKLTNTATNTRLILPENIYKIELTRTGYRPWSRSIEINGGTVIRYDYPLLIPNKLSTSKIKTYASQPALVTQSLDRRWLVAEIPGSDSTFDLYDISVANKVPVKAPTVIALPANVLTKATVNESLSVVAWSSDNQHVLLNHLYDSKNEYIMLDIANPDQSFNLSQSLSSLNFTELSLVNEKYNQYYLYNAADQTLANASLGNPSAENVVLHNVLAYSSYSTNTILYATSSGAPSGKVNIDELVGSQDYHIKTFDSGGNYLLDMAGYNGVIYVAAGASNQNKVYIYQDPAAQLSNNPKQAPVPSQVLLITNPNYLSFSINTQFIMAEGGQQFGVYDIQNSHGYSYTNNSPIDSPQTHATWMDGDRLSYVSGGKLVIFDYDNNYQQVLVDASSQFLPFFSPAFNNIYTIATQPDTQISLTQTSMFTVADQ